MQTRNNIPRIFWSLPGDRAEQDCACADDGLTPVVLWMPSTERAEDDCACPDHGIAPALTAPFNADTPWRRPSHLYREPLPSDHELIFNPIGRAGAVVLNQPARRILDGTIRESGVRIPVRPEVYEPVLADLEAVGVAENSHRPDGPGENGG